MTKSEKSGWMIAGLAALLWWLQRPGMVTETAVTISTGEGERVRSISESDIQYAVDAGGISDDEANILRRARAGYFSELDPVIVDDLVQRVLMYTRGVVYYEDREQRGVINY